MTTATPRPTPLAPVGVDGFFQPRRVAFWLLVFLLANGAFSVATQVMTASRIVPVAVLFGLVLWSFYAAVALLFFRSLDAFELHPPLGFVLALAWGGLGAVYLGL